MLPEDLDGAMRALDDEAFQRLSQAVAQEARRRMPASTEAGPSRSTPASAADPGRKAPAVEGLTPAKARLIRAAAKAGLRPNAIVKEFGVTIAMVRAALAGA